MVPIRTLICPRMPSSARSAQSLISCVAWTPVFHHRGSGSFPFQSHVAFVVGSGVVLRFPCQTSRRTFTVLGSGLPSDFTLGQTQSKWADFSTDLSSLIPNSVAILYFPRWIKITWTELGSYLKHYLCYICGDVAFTGASGAWASEVCMAAMLEHLKVGCRPWSSFPTKFHRSDR